jgi:hypothetical protein
MIDFLLEEFHPQHFVWTLFDCLDIIDEQFVDFSYEVKSEFYIGLTPSHLVVIEFVQRPYAIL